MVSSPLQICTIPMMMMRARASSLPAVNISCTRVAHLTLEQFTHVSSTRQKKKTKENTGLVHTNLKEYRLLDCRYLWTCWDL